MNQEKNRLHHQAKWGRDSVYRSSRWHRMAHSQGLREHKALSDLQTKGAEKVGSFPDFLRETFTRAYTGDTATRLKDPAPGSDWAQRMHKLMEDLPEWQRMTERCKGSAYDAELVTQAVGEKAYVHVPKHNHDAKKAEDMMKMLEQDLAEGEPVTDEQIERAKNRFARACHEAKDKANQIDETGFRQMVRKVLAKANEELDKKDQAMGALGFGSGPGKAQTGGSQELKDKLARRLGELPKLQDILELAGRMNLLSQALQKAKPERGAGELTDIETGDDLSRLLPSETASLAHPLMKKLLWRKLTEKSALQYKLEDREPKKRGPIVVCVDNSSSMSLGNREVWAKALAVAMMDLARRQKRAFAFCLFNGGIYKTVTESEAKRMSVADLLDILSSGPSGGTNWDHPINWAMSEIKKDGVMEKADVIFITDGECTANSARINSEKDKLGARIYSFLINDQSEHDFSSLLAPFSDLVTRLTDLAKPMEGEAKKAIEPVLSL